MNIRLIACAVVGIAASQVASAQLVTESIDLNAGWNAVWVNLEPEPNTLDEILAAQSPALDYQSIWTFEQSRPTGVVAIGAIAGQWFFRDRDASPVVSSLQVLHGQRGYLIHMRSAGQLQLVGRPLIRSTQFAGQSSTLFGVLADAASGLLSFEDFFSHPRAIGKVRTSGTPATHDIFTLSAGNYIKKSFTSAVQPNIAYWVNVIQDFEYPGLLDVTSSSNGLAFGRTTSLRTLRIQVPNSTSVRTLHLQALPCAVLSTVGTCSQGGESIDWLQYRDPNQTSPVWQPLSAGLTLNVPAGTTQVEVELRARRADLAAAARNRNGGTQAESFPLVVNVTDDQGAQAVLSANVTIEPVFGTWVGRAVLDHVSIHPALQALSLDQAEAPPLGMTLLLDLPDPAGGGSPQLLDSLAVSIFRDGRPLTRVFNSILFDRPVALTGDPGDPLDPLGATGTLHGTLHISPEDPLNPYRHRYHPEHRKGYDITRDITIQLQPAPSSSADVLAGLDGTFGPLQLTGQYTEVITGISALPITIQGSFRLERLVGQSSTLLAGQ